MDPYENGEELKKEVWSTMSIQLKENYSNGVRGGRKPKKVPSPLLFIISS